MRFLNEKAPERDEMTKMKKISQLARKLSKDISHGNASAHGVLADGEPIDFAVEELVFEIEVAIDGFQKGLRKLGFRNKLKVGK